MRPRKTWESHMSDFVAWLRGLATKGGKGVVNNLDARSLGAAADEMDAARRRIVVLEMVIRQDLWPVDCRDDLNRMIVQDIHDRYSVAPSPPR
jgi:hypothetical protein